MIEELEIKGLWWLPEKSNLKLPGILTFSPYKGFFLEVQGSFKEIGEMHKFLTPDIILGFSHQGKNITLYKCFETSHKGHFPEIPESIFSVNVGFIGVHFTQLSEIKFKKVSVRYNYLDEWLNISGFNITNNPKEKSAEIRYKLPAPVEVNLKNGLKILLEVKASMPSISVVQKEACIKQETFFTLEFPKETTFEDAHKFIYIFQNLLSLLTSEIVYPIKILGNSENAVKIIEDKKFYEPIEIIYQLSLSHVKSKKSVYPFDMLYPYISIKNKAETIFNNWLEKTQILRPVYDLYFGTIYSGDMYLEFQFLSLIMALEVYHRRMIRNEDIPSKEHEERIKQILNNTPDKYRDWLKEKLKYSNEPSLRKRIKEIYDILKNIGYVTDLIPKKKDFVDKVVNTRNYFVHYDQSLKDKALKGAELYWLIQKLKILVEICLLKEIGFLDTEIDNIFQQRKYKWLIERTKELK